MLRGLISTSALSPMGGGAGGAGTAIMADGDVLDKRRNFDRLSAVLDLKGGEPLAVRALGALLHHLQTTTFQLEPGGLVPVQTLERFDLNRYVRLDSNAFSSLQVHIYVHTCTIHLSAPTPTPTPNHITTNTQQIFHEERHPNVISGKGRSKEGFSLYALLDQTHSRPGRACLREWMLRPLRQPEAIVRRQRVVDLLMQVRVCGLCVCRSRSSNPTASRLTTRHHTQHNIMTERGQRGHHQPAPLPAQGRQHQPRPPPPPPLRRHLQGTYVL